MVRKLLLVLVLFTAAPAAACPEVIVPLSPRDPALRSPAWRQALRHYRARHHRKALEAIRGVSARLEREVERLFHPNTDGDAAPSQKIQRWLQRHVYTASPGVLIHSDRYTYPPLVWWAWADTACRAGAHREAKTALARLRDIRPGSDMLHHEIIVGIRLGETERARALLAGAPPDGFLTPYLEGLLAKADGRVEQARRKLGEARAASVLLERQEAVDRELRALETPEGGP